MKRATGGIKHLEVNEAIHLAEGFRRMVAEQAWITWRRLPPHTRAWLSVEDMVSDGMRWAVMDGVPAWEPKKGRLSTWMYIGLRTYFDKTYESWYLVQKRHEGGTFSLQGLLLNKSEEHKSDTLVMADRLGDVAAPEKIIMDCYVADLIKDIYDEGSKNLQAEIKRWFLGGLERIRLTSPTFVKASSEFRERAGARHLHYEECRHLLGSPSCLDRLSRAVMHTPYDLNYPTPGIRGYGQ
jgi:hypothetical protein